MSLITRTLTSAVAAIGLLVATPGLAHADTDLAGHWTSSSLRTDGVGYTLSLTATSSPTSTYAGVLVFHFQDGRLGKRIRVGLAQEGNDLTMVMPGGSLASGSKTLSGSVGQDGSIYVKNCQRQLAYVTKATAPEMCLFQEFPLN